MARTEKEQLWTGRMVEWERSGTSRRRWCAANGVSVHTFDYWRRRLRSRTVAKRPRRQRLVPVVVKPAPGAPASAVTIEIALPGGIALRAPATVETRWLAALVREIGAC
jgi:hypothetical protein